MGFSTLGFIGFGFGVRIEGSKMWSNQILTKIHQIIHLYTYVHIHTYTHTRTIIMQPPLLEIPCTTPPLDSAPHLLAPSHKHTLTPIICTQTKYTPPYSPRPKITLQLSFSNPSPIPLLITLSNPSPPHPLLLTLSNLSPIPLQNIPLFHATPTSPQSQTYQPPNPSNPQPPNPNPLPPTPPFLPHNASPHPPPKVNVLRVGGRGGGGGNEKVGEVEYKQKDVVAIREGGRMEYVEEICFLHNFRLIIKSKD